MATTQIPTLESTKATNRQDDNDTHHADAKIGTSSLTPKLEDLGTGIAPVISNIVEGTITLPTHPGKGLPEPRPPLLKGSASTEEILAEYRGR